MARYAVYVIRKRTSLYTALTIAVMSSVLLMSYAVLQYVPWTNSQEALLVRAPMLTTDTWAVFDTQSGAIRYGNKVTNTAPIASVSKLFTAYAVYALGSEKSTTTIEWSDLNTEGETGKLAYGETYTLDELLFPLLMESSNDAGATVARSLGDRFASTVALVIQSEGLTETTIIEPTGLSPQNVSSPRDLAKFYTFVRRMYPHIIDITQLNMYKNHDAWLVNNIPVHELPSFSGGKHGFTPEAGKTFVGTFEIDGLSHEIGVVLLGSTDLRKDIEQILGSFN